jgi:hypothetical protein
MLFGQAIPAKVLEGLRKRPFIRVIVSYRTGGRNTQYKKVAARPQPSRNGKGLAPNLARYM